MQKQDILSLSFDELLSHCLEMGEKKFRVDQLYQWLWQKRVRSFDEMSNLSKQFREQLQHRFYFQTVKVMSFSSLRLLLEKGPSTLSGVKKGSA